MESDFTRTRISTKSVQNVTCFCLGIQIIAKEESGFPLWLMIRLMTYNSIIEIIKSQVIRRIISYKPNHKLQSESKIPVERYAKTYQEFLNHKS